jgi:hypothetical protein
MAPRTALTAPKVIRQAISRASDAVARALAHCEDHDGSYRAMLDPAALARFEDVSRPLCEAAEHMERAARSAKSL